MKKPTHFFSERGGRKFILVFLMCVFSFHKGYSQSYFSTGASSNGLAGAVCAIDDETHTLQSVASSAFAKDVRISSHYKNHYLLPGIYALSALAILPVKSWVLALSGEKMGPSHYQELNMGISIGHRIEHTALGLRANWKTLQVEGFQTQHALVFEFGGITNLSPHLKFGGAIYNFTLSKFENKLLPVTLRCGLSGTTNTHLLFTAEIEKNNYETLVIKGGAHYAFHDRFNVSIGYVHPSARIHAGLNATYHRVILSYSFAWHLRLGISQDFSIAYTLKKKTP